MDLSKYRLRIHVIDSVATQRFQIQSPFIIGGMTDSFGVNQIAYQQFQMAKNGASDVPVSRYLMALLSTYGFNCQFPRGVSFDDLESSSGIYDVYCAGFTAANPYLLYIYEKI